MPPRFLPLDHCLARRLQHHLADPVCAHDLGVVLGLAIGRHVCRLMGDDLTVECAYGQRSTVTIRLPGDVARPS